MVRVELAGGRVDEVAALSDCQRNDARCRLAEPINDGLHIANGQKIDQMTRDLEFRAEKMYFLGFFFLKTKFSEK